MSRLIEKLLCGRCPAYPLGCDREYMGPICKSWRKINAPDVVDNAERIQAMNYEELAAVTMPDSQEWCNEGRCRLYGEQSCYMCTLAWLQEPAKEVKK